MRRPCSICSDTFSVQFSYQIEQRETESGSAAPFSYFCSQRCLEESHRGRGGAVQCDACQGSFTVELAAHVIFAGGTRRYACSPECRSQLLPRRRELRTGGAADTTLRLVPTSEVTPALTQRHASSGSATRAPVESASPAPPAAAPAAAGSPREHSVSVPAAAPNATRR